MRTIAVAAQKGGAGKSTLAIHLASLAMEEGGAALVDCDPQGSLTWWHGQRADADPALVEAPGDPNRMRAALDAARAEGLGWALVDLPPHDSAITAEAMRAADLVLVPTRPAALDTVANRATLAMAARLDVPALVVLTQCPPRRGFMDPPDVADARALLQADGAQVAETTITTRAVVARSIVAGATVGELEPSGAAAREFRRLWAEVKERTP